jgi:cytochrome c oxidase cbb3-type subunit IV
MNITLLREISTVLCLAAFVGIVAWAYSRRNVADFEQAARLPLEQD